MGKTKIEWTEWSINPIRAKLRATGAVGHYCELVSQGCANCYASSLQKRFQMPGFGGGQHRDDVDLFLDESKLQKVIRATKPRVIFWCSMTDLFGHWVPDAWIDLCFAAMLLTPHHIHQVLTKRPNRALDYMTKRRLIPGGTMMGGVEPWKTPCDDIYQVAKVIRPKGRPSELPLIWPLPNVWLGTSIESQAHEDRVEVLAKVPAAVRFLSAEPLLGPLQINLDGINWVIVGGESGPWARPMHPAWARSLRTQCNEAGVPFFFKQWGEWAPSPDGGLPDNLPDHVGFYFAPPHLPHKVWRFGKQAAGRLLDGRTWDEMPGVTGG